MRTSQVAIISGLVLAVVIGVAGCNETASAPAGDDSRAARLCQDEMYSMSQQMKAMQKKMEENDAATAAVQKDKADSQKAYDETANFLMEQAAQKDAEIEKLKARIEEMEKAQTPAAAK
jgi:hypothetical protein